MLDNQRTSETQLDVRQNHQPGPAVRRLWAATRQGDLADLDRAAPAHPVLEVGRVLEERRIAAGGLG